MKTIFKVVFARGKNGINVGPNREEYRSQLIETNRKQREFYQESWPSILSGLDLIRAANFFLFLNL